MSATSRTRALTSPSALSEENSRQRLFCRDTTAAAMVSAVVNLGKIWMSWNARASPRSASATGPMPAISAPMKRTSPSVGFSRPVSRLTSVVLPAPFGPTTETSSCSLTVMVTFSSARNGP